MRSGSNPSNASRKRARLLRMTRHERPAWKPSSTSLANSSRSPCSGTPHSSSWQASINGAASSPVQQRRFMAPEFCTDVPRPASIRAMRFLQVSEREGRYVASLAEAAPPVPRDGEVLVRVAASGVNRADLLQIAGRYPPPAGEPDIIGLELSGTSDAVGAAVCALVTGGGHAEYVAAPAGQASPVPTRSDLVTAAGIPEAFLTAFVNLVMEAGLGRGETLLVHAGASGVGLAAIQLGKLLGARVAATTRTSEKVVALTRAGADLVIDTGRHDFAEQIEERWGRDAVDVVLDPIGAPSLAGDMRVLATGGRGRVVCISTMGGARAELDLALVMRKRARLLGSTLRARSRAEKGAIVARFAREVLPGFASGDLAVPVDSVFPVDRAAEAFQRMRENRNVGKILIAWPRD